MGDSGKATGAVAEPAGGAGRSQSTRLLGWLRASPREGDVAAGDQLEELERELMLLREENARLKVRREHADDRSVGERVRAALPALRDDDPDGDEPWEVLTECMLLRDGLIDACRELERGARELRGRLETLLPNAEGTDTGTDTAAGPAGRPRGDFEGVV
jgi:hypothetical protein